MTEKDTLLNDDASLIGKAVNGDLSAFSQLVLRYETSIRSCLAVRLNQPCEADDLAQDTFIIAFNRINEFDQTRSFGAWLRGIAFNLLKNYWRKNKAIPVGGVAELEMLIDDDINLSFSQDNEADSLLALKSCMTKLDDPMKEILALHYEQECTVGELTKKYGVKHSAMTMRLHRIRERLKKCIDLQLGRNKHDK